MKRLTSLLIGLFTVLIFGGVGITLLMGHRYWFGGGVMALALFRLVVWIRQLRYTLWEMSQEEEGEGPPDVP